MKMMVIKKVCARNTQCIILLILSHSSATRLHPTSCTEDSQCPSGFFCEEDAHYCRECISCNELKRESPPPRDACVKSVVDCGACLDGLVQEYEGLDGQCVPPGGRSRGRSLFDLLPPYAWAAIAISVLLIILIIYVFVKLNTNKVLYSSHTSVQPPRAAVTRTAPPPYNDVQRLPPLSSPQSLPPPDNEALENSKLMEWSLPCAPSPETPENLSIPLRIRENSDHQEAQVFNNPAYPRLPRNTSRCDTPEMPASVFDDHDSRNMSIVSLGGQREREIIQDGNDYFNNNEHKDKVSNNAAALLKKNLEVEDCNNISEESAPQQRPGGSAQYCSNMLAGPSFVINVVENINTIQEHKTTKIT